MKPETSPTPRSFRAIISPCSGCQNFQTDPQKGTPACPRRYWEEQSQAFIQGTADVEEPPQYLLAKNNDGTRGYQNPVYDAPSQTAVVWVAPLLLNLGSRAPSGELQTGSILEKEAFDTRYIRCQMIPVTPSRSWAELASSGLYKEWDQVVVDPLDQDQWSLQIGGTDVPESPVKIGGVCTKLNFTFSFPMTSPKTDRVPSGM